MSISELLVREAAAQGVRIAVAESLTGGSVSARIVDVPGASQVFLGGVVSYATELKHSILGVSERLLAEHGPVHPDVAEAMAAGVRTVCALSGREHEREHGAAPSADLGLATTGVAGPEPDAQSGQQAGVVWIGVSSCLGDRAIRLELTGDRAAIREQATLAALQQGVHELTRLAVTRNG